MTKIRTANQLQDTLDNEFAWRLKEIHDIRVAARKADSASQKTFVRAGVALLYAHWEGFVKASAEAYVNYRACKGLRYEELRSCFVALGVKGHLNQIRSSAKSEVTVSALDFILKELGRRAELPMRDSVDTESNLSSTVFRNIAGWIGIDAERYATKFNLVDESLLKRRNRIAHGQYLEIEATLLTTSSTKCWNSFAGSKRTWRTRWLLRHTCGPLRLPPPSSRRQRVSVVREASRWPTTPPPAASTAGCTPSQPSVSSACSDSPRAPFCFDPAVIQRSAVPALEYSLRLLHHVHQDEKAARPEAWTKFCAATSGLGFVIL